MGREQVLWLRQRPHKGTRGVPRGTAGKRNAVYQAHATAANGWRDLPPQAASAMRGAVVQRRARSGAQDGRCEQAKKEVAGCRQQLTRLGT